MDIMGIQEVELEKRVTGIMLDMGVLWFRQVGEILCCR